MHTLWVKGCTSELTLRWHGQTVHLCDQFDQLVTKKMVKTICIYHLKYLSLVFPGYRLVSFTDNKVLAIQTNYGVHCLTICFPFHNSWDATDLTERKTSSVQNQLLCMEIVHKQPTDADIAAFSQFCSYMGHSVTMRWEEFGCKSCFYSDTVSRCTKVLYKLMR